MIATLTAIFLTAAACNHSRASNECGPVGFIVATALEQSMPEEL